MSKIEPNNDNQNETSSQTSQIDKFRQNARLCIEYICEASKRIPNKPVYPSVQPGYLRALIPNRPPNQPEEFKQMLEDFNKFIMPGIMHWNHPNMYAYFPCGNAFSNILADMLSIVFGGVGFSWTSQPALTELENAMLDWFGRILNLPSQFLFEESNGIGGGCTQSSASEATFSIMIAARYQALKTQGFFAMSNSMKDINDEHPAAALGKLVCYASEEAHSSVEKSANISLVKIRLLHPDERHKITGEILEKAIEEDKNGGLIPFLMVATIGSTGGCAFDDLNSIGPVCKKYGMWLHVDGAYGGNSFILPEMEHLRRGLEFADSINVNPYKLLLAALDLACMWVRDVDVYKQPWIIDATYLMDVYNTKMTEISKRSDIEYRNYGIALSRRMRALKLWFLFRSYGVEGLQEHVRRIVKLAKHFENLVRSDDRFEVTNIVELGVVCFRQVINSESSKKEDQEGYCEQQNMNLLYRINKSKKIHMCPCILLGRFSLRISVNYEFATEKDIEYAWKVIQSLYVTKLDEEWCNDPGMVAILSDPLSFLSAEQPAAVPTTERKYSLPLAFGRVGVPQNRLSRS